MVICMEYQIKTDGDVRKAAEILANAGYWVTIEHRENKKNKRWPEYWLIVKEYSRNLGGKE
jgi:hypothetical protein